MSYWHLTFDTCSSQFLHPDTVHQVIPIRRETRLKAFDSLWPLTDQQLKNEQVGLGDLSSLGNGG